jgi:fatty acid desaturase
MKQLLNQEMNSWLKDHHKTNVWKVLFDIAMTWMVIGFAIWFGLTFQTWWSYLLSVLVIGSRQHALGTLVHDGTHYTLAKNRNVNDFLSDFFCALPIFISTRGFRIFHITHHRYTRTEKDPEVHAGAAHPDYIWPKNKNEAYKVLIKDLLGINALSAFGNIFIWSDVPSLMGKSKEHWIKQKIVPGIAEFLDRTNPRYRISTKVKLGLLAYYISLFSVLTYFSWWKVFLLYWVVPMFSVLAFIIRLRGMSEHNGLKLETELNSSRTTLWKNPVMAYLVTPFFVNYHLEHHLFPQVPYFHLKDLHHELMKQDLYKNEAAISTNYISNLVK